MTPQTSSDPLGLVGTVVAEKYAVESVVGEGGFAIVYRAEHTLWKRPVALKVFRALDDVRPEDRAKLLDDFVREGALLAELSERSTAICQARDVGMLKTARGTDLPYMVLEWLEGRALDAVLEDEKRAGLPLRTLGETLALLAPAADALGLAHERGIAHRDVKPANIFVLGGDARAPDAAVKLLDFGIAKVVQDAHKMAASFSKTAGQATSFTPAYGAPEQFSRQYGATGPWTDTFALALIVAEVMTGREPLDGNDIGQLAFASIDPARRPTPRTLGADVPDAVEAIFAKAVAVKPEDRFASARALWSALTGVASGGGAAAIRPSDAADRDLAIAATAVGPAVASTGVRPSVATTSAGATVESVAGPAASAPRRSRARPAAIGIGVLAVVGGVALFASRDRANAGAAGAAASGMVRDPAGPSGSHHAGAAGSSHDGKAPAGAHGGGSAKCPSGTREVAAADFVMGDSAAANDIERPGHQVTLSHAFCLAVHEVTVAEYAECVDRRKCEHLVSNEWPGIKPGERRTYDPLCNGRDVEHRGEHPMNCVHWKMAEAYCRFRDMRLPTEAEWELAARPSARHRYPWGDEDPGSVRTNACGLECVRWKKKNGAEDALSKMYAADDGYETTAPSGNCPTGATASGVVDMFGNVSEWVEDWYAPYEEGKDAPLVDPHGPKDGEKRVVRGGAWNSYEVAWLRPTYRYMAPPETRSHGIGFRCAKTLP